VIWGEENSRGERRRKVRDVDVTFKEDLRTKTNLRTPSEGEEDTLVSDERPPRDEVERNYPGYRQAGRMFRDDSRGSLQTRQPKGR